MDLALNNLQRLICHKTKQTQTLESVMVSWGYLVSWIHVIELTTIIILEK